MRYDLWGSLVSHGILESKVIKLIGYVCKIRENRLEKQKSIMPENKDYGTCVLIYNVQIIIALFSGIIIRVKQIH